MRAGDAYDFSLSRGQVSARSLLLIVCLVFNVKQEVDSERQNRYSGDRCEHVNVLRIFLPGRIGCHQATKKDRTQFRSFHILAK